MSGPFRGGFNPLSTEGIKIKQVDPKSAEACAYLTVMLFSEGIVNIELHWRMIHSKILVLVRILIRAEADRSGI